MGKSMYREDWDRNFSSIWAEMERTLHLSGAATAVLLDVSGNAVTYAGEDPEFDLSSFASLAVGDYLATQEMAALLGEKSMQWVMHQGINGGLALAPLHPLLILAVIFDQRTTLGLVRHQMRKDRARLEEVAQPLIRLLQQQLFEPEAVAGPEAESAAEAASADEIIGRGLEQLFGHAT